MSVPKNVEITAAWVWFAWNFAVFFNIMEMYICDLILKILVDGFETRCNFILGYVF